MAKTDELREMSSEQIRLTWKEATEHLFKLRIQAQTERLDAPSEVRRQRRLIARCQTILRERELAAAKDCQERAGEIELAAKLQAIANIARVIRIQERFMPKRVEIGVVVSDKTAKTRRVEIARLVRHAKYGKILHRKTVCHMHDETNESHQGDTVEIRECPPRSKLKRWELVRVVTKSQAVDIAAMRTAARLADSEAELTKTT